MTLYKNVDICDLESIMSKGILSATAAENFNWESDKRSNNSYDVVYLFKPLTEENSFVQYGAALIEIDIDNATENEMTENDRNKGKYIEYVCEYVAPEKIRKIYIPAILKNRVSIESDKIEYVHIEADVWAESVDIHGVRKSTMEEDATVFEQFAKTAAINSYDFNYFRGVAENNTMIDLQNVSYLIR